MQFLGIVLIGLGAVLVVAGIALVLIGRGDGEQPTGDITVQSNTLSVHIPCLSMIVISVVGSLLLTLILNLLARLFNR